MLNQTLKILLAVLAFSSAVQAQTNATISGSIAQTDNKPAEAVLISLLQSPENTLYKTAFTDSSGNFQFAALPAGSYTVSVDDPGFKNYQSSEIQLSQSDIVLPLITLETREGQQLQEVVIEKRRALVERKLDRTVVNVDAMISNAGADAMEVLEKSPGIIVDQDGTITMNGRSGIQVFIDDKPSNLSGADLESFLRSLPASTVNQIELITNPPAKYEAAGSAGIINIITKKSKARGFNGNLNSRVSHGKRGQVRNSVNLNYTNSKVRVFGTLSHAVQESVTELYIFRRYKNEDGTVKSLFDQNTMIETGGNNTSARLGMDYYVSDRTTIGVGVTGLIRSGWDDKDGSSVLRDAGMLLDSTIVAKNRERDSFKNGGFNLNFRHQIDSIGRKITADADFVTYATDSDQIFRNYVYQPDNSLSSEDDLRGSLPAKISIYAFKTDYSHPFKKGSQVDAGYKVSYSKTDNKANYSDILGGVSTPNYDLSNHFRYDEVINAAYVNYSINGKRWGAQAGLRLENTASKGHQLGNEGGQPESRFEKHYTNLFPTVYVSYKLDSIANNQLILSYGKRIDRPYFQDLNPFVSPLDKFTYYSGNPFLNPTFTHNVQLTYSYKNLFSTALVYSDTKDNINETIEIRDGIYYSRPGNIGTSKTISLNANADLKLTKWYSINLYSEVTNNDYSSRLYTETLDANGTYWFVSGLNRFNLGKDWSAEVGGRYHTDIVSSQFIALSRGSVNLSVMKKVMKGKGSLRLLANDIFYTNLNNGVINNLKDTDAHWRNKGDTRSVALAFTWSFGKMFEAKNTHDSTGSQSEQERVKE